MFPVIVEALPTLPPETLPTSVPSVIVQFMPALVMPVRVKVPAPVFSYWLKP